MRQPVPLLADQASRLTALDGVAETLVGVLEGVGRLDRGVACSVLVFAAIAMVVLAL